MQIGKKKVKMDKGMKSGSSSHDDATIIWIYFFDSPYGFFFVRVVIDDLLFILKSDGPDTA